MTKAMMIKIYIEICLTFLTVLILYATTQQYFYVATDLVLAIWLLGGILLGWTFKWMKDDI